MNRLRILLCCCCIAIVCCAPLEQQELSLKKSFSFDLKYGDTFRISSTESGCRLFVNREIYSFREEREEQVFSYYNIKHDSISNSFVLLDESVVSKDDYNSIITPSACDTFLPEKQPLVDRGWCKDNTPTSGSFSVYCHSSRLAQVDHKFYSVRLEKSADDKGVVLDLFCSKSESNTGVLLSSQTLGKTSSIFRLHTCDFDKNGINEILIEEDLFGTSTIIYHIFSLGITDLKKDNE